MKNPNITLVDKENVPFLNFPKEDVLNEKKERKRP